MEKPEIEKLIIDYIKKSYRLPITVVTSATKFRDELAFDSIIMYEIDFYMSDQLGIKTRNDTIQLFDLITIDDAVNYYYDLQNIDNTDESDNG